MKENSIFLDSLPAFCVNRSRSRSGDVIVETTGLLLYYGREMNIGNKQIIGVQVLRTVVLSNLDELHGVLWWAGRRDNVPTRNFENLNLGYHGDIRPPTIFDYEDPSNP
jgi:hypothetical protein